MISQESEIAELVWTGWPNYCEILGPTTVESIVHGAVAGPEYGDRRIDLKDIADTIIAAVAVVRLWLEIRRTKRELSPNETIDEIRTVMPKAAEDAAFDEETKRRLRRKIEEEP
jgi:hypothetical protein